MVGIVFGLKSKMCLVACAIIQSVDMHRSLTLEWICDADADADAGTDIAGSDADVCMYVPGCGVGGSSRQISRRFGTSMTGISLSPVQVSSDIRTYVSYAFR